MAWLHFPTILWSDFIDKTRIYVVTRFKINTPATPFNFLCHCREIQDWIDQRTSSWWPTESLDLPPNNSTHVVLGFFASCSTGWLPPPLLLLLLAPMSLLWRLRCCWRLRLPQPLDQIRLQSLFLALDLPHLSCHTWSILLKIKSLVRHFLTVLNTQHRRCHHLISRRFPSSLSLSVSCSGNTYEMCDRPVGGLSTWTQLIPKYTTECL